MLKVDWRMNKLKPDNECECLECYNNDDGICELSYLVLDENGYCLDKDMRIKE
jgi:hypothetical protein